MNIQKLPDQNTYDKKLPAKAVVIQLLDKDKNHLAFITYFYQRKFQYWNPSNGYEESQFLQELSDIENEMLHTCFEMDKDLEDKFGDTGGLFITDENAEVILQERPVPETEKNSDLLMI